MNTLNYNTILLIIGSLMLLPALPSTVRRRR